MILIFASGCAPLHWHKAGADAATLERDLGECQGEARLQAQHQSPLFGLPRPPVVGMDARGRIVTGDAGRHDTERAMLEHDFMRACMQERGYELAPAQAR